MFTLCLILCIVASATGLKLPEYINSCSRNDPNLNECALKSARESLQRFSMGDPARGLDPLDPLFVPVMTVYVPNENGLKLVLNENSFSGLSSLRLDDLNSVPHQVPFASSTETRQARLIQYEMVSHKHINIAHSTEQEHTTRLINRFDLNKKMILADALVNLDVTSKYDLSGKLLIIPIKSSGDSSIKLKNANLHIRFWYEHIDGGDGNIHWKIVKHDIKYEVEKASFRLENLLNDKTIGDQVNRFLNEMWREIVTDVGPSICQSLSAAMVQNLDKLLAQVPYDDLLPE